MSISPSISNIITIRSLSQAGRILSVGVVRQDGKVFWGDCVSKASRSDAELDSDAERIGRLITPFFLGQVLDELRPLLIKLDSIIEIIIESRTVITPPSPGVSRRKFISGLLAEDTPQSYTEEIRIERPLPARLRYGVGQALLTAVAHTHNCSPIKTLTREYDLVQPNTSIATHGEIEDSNPALIDRFIADRVDSIGYTTAGKRVIEQLGDQGQQLQRFVRQVKERMAATSLPGEVQAAIADYNPTIHLNLRGAFSELYDNQSGKILGALYGLEQATRPFALRVEQPVTADQKTILDQLKHFIPFRNMSVQIGITARTPEELALWDHESIDFVKLCPLTWGSLEQFMVSIKQCRESGLDILLGIAGEETPTSLSTLVQIGLAFKVNGLLTAKNSHRLVAYNQMLRVEMEEGAS